MQQWGILGIGVLVLGLFTIGFGVQDVWAPDNDKPEKLVVKGTGYNSDTGNFEINALVLLPTDAPLGYSVETSLSLFKPDGTPLRATALEIIDRITENTEVVTRGNHNVYEILINVLYDPSVDELDGEIVKVVGTFELLDEEGEPVELRPNRIKAWVINF